MKTSKLSCSAKSGSNVVPGILQSRARNRSKNHARTANPKARIIIRNVSFLATEDDIRHEFSKYGEIKDVNILTTAGGKRVGCAFVQFLKVPSACEAIKNMNLKEFKGRPVALDWAIPKSAYIDQGKAIGFNKTNGSPCDIKLEPAEINCEPCSDEEESPDIKPSFSQEGPTLKHETNSDADSETGSISGDAEYDSEDDDALSGKKPNFSKNKRPRQANDAEDGRTVFIRNISFDTDQQGLREFMENSVGPVSYAVLCMDKMTEHPRGTGFVKFKDADDAKKCIDTSKQFVNPYEVNHNGDQNKTDALNLAGRRLIICPALNRSSVVPAQKTKARVSSDKRNLFLAREGLIRQGTQAAEGVSKQDMNKRLSLELTKKQLLRNLSIFVSPTRLCIHNLPRTLDDQGLRTLFARVTPPGSKIFEAKVMRHQKEFDEKGCGVSKGFGFVTLSEHDHALQALRKLNNNPTVFTRHRRPIVEFSLENLSAVRAKEKRMQKSVENMKVSSVRAKRKKPVLSKEKEPDEVERKDSGNDKIDVASEANEKANFTGFLADPKVKGLPSHTGPKIRTRKRSRGSKKKGKGQVPEKQSFGSKLKVQTSGGSEKNSRDQVSGATALGSKPKISRKFFRGQRKVKRLHTNHSSRLDSSVKQASSRGSKRMKSGKMNFSSDNKFHSLVDKYKKGLSNSFVSKGKWYQQP